MDKYEQMVRDITGAPPADVTAGLPPYEGTPAAGVLDRPTLTAKQRANHDKAQRMKANREAQSKRMKARWAARRAEKNGRAVEMPQSYLSEPGQGQTPTGSAGVQGTNQQHGVSSVRVPDLSRTGGDVDGSIPEIQPHIEAADPSLQPFIANQHPFNINVQMFLEMPLDHAQAVLDELRAQTSALAEAIEHRRQEEKADDPSKCLFCKQPFPEGRYFTRFPFELLPGSNQWRAIYACRKQGCLDKLQMAVDKIQKAIQDERGV